MKTRTVFFVCFWLLLFSVQGAEFLIPRLVSPPQMDGVIQTSEWQGCSAYDLKTADGQAPVNPSTVHIGYGDDHLFLALQCQEKNVAGMVTTYGNREEHDNQIWNDDSIDLSIAPFGDDRSYKIIINSAGIFYDALNGDINWESHLEAGAHIGSDAWSVEMKIPFEHLGFYPRGGEFWNLNIGRNRRADRELSSLTGAKGSFLDNMQKFRFAGDGDFVLTAVNGQSNQVLTGFFRKPGAYEVRLETVSGPNRQMHYDQTVEVAEAGKECHFPWSGAKNPDRLDLKIRGVYENTFAPPPLRSSDMRVWVSDQPLYQELVAAMPEPLPSFRWFHEKEHYLIISQALQFGFAFDQARVYRDIVATNNLIYTGYHELANEQSAQYRQNFNMRLIVNPDHRRVDIPATSKKAKFLGDPLAEARFLEQVEELCDRRQELNLGAIIFGDERAEHAIATLVAFHQEKQDYPLIAEINEKIKREYGGGTWGIPESMTDPAPGRWIATHQFISVQLASLLERAYRIVKRKAPDLPLVTDDPVDGATTQDMAMWRGNFDIATAQLYPRRNPDLADFAYNTKKVKDLSGAKVMQPCAHVEHYAGNFSLAETRALMGQAVIGGANGWHLYLADTIGRRSGKSHLITEYFGAPDRYQLIYNIAAATPQLNYPEPDCAFFVSQDNSWSTYRYRPDAEAAVFTMLGPRAGLWFDMINETTMPTQNLANYKAIFISDAQYERQAAIDRLEEYVRKGGVLVVFDPHAFERNQLDEDIAKQSNQLLGAKISPEKSDLVLIFQQKSYSLPLACNSLELLGDATAVAHYGSGLPAVSCRTLGDGRIYRFAFNPAAGRFLKARQWQDFMKDFTASLQLKTDQPVWRFAFPADLQPKPTPPKGKCLTGNSISWTLFKPDGKANLPPVGSYSWSRRPDVIADGGVAGIPFTEGKLTNRRKAPGAGNVDKGHGVIKDWVVKFQRNEPIAVTFDLQSEQAVGRLQLYYQGEEPKVELEVSSDADTWQKITRWTKNSPSGQVQELVLQLDQAIPARYVRVTFPALGPESKPLTLAEVDIWDQ